MAELSGLVGKLAGMEERASRIYWKAAAAASGDAALQGLLQGLAHEEDEHMRLLVNMEGYIKSTGSLAALDINEEAVKSTSDYFGLAEKRIDAGKLTSENIVDCIATTETSEWNAEFLKVMNALKDDSRFFIPIAARIQQHKRSVERFLASRPGFKRFLAGMRSLPSVWSERLLIVDDDRAIADAITAVLAEEGEVDSASNGQEAIEKIRSGYYAAIVSDYSMPVMNGMELLRKAQERFPGIKSRFLFFTSDYEGAEHLKGKGVKLLMKPASAGELAGEVASILARPY